MREKSDKSKNPGNIKLSVRGMVIVTFLMTFTTVLVVFSTWIFVSLGEENIAKTNKAHVDLLQSQLSELRLAVRTQETLAENNVVIGSSVTTQ